MSKYIHVFNTWCLANILQPFSIILLNGDVSDIFNLFSNSEDLSLFITLSFIGVLLSLPCLFISWIVFGRIINSTFPWQVKLLIWWFVACTIIIIDVLGILGIFAPFDILRTTFLLASPGILSVCLSIIIRTRQFKKHALEVSFLSDQTFSEERVQAGGEVG